jgi:hypothetical protein
MRSSNMKTAFKLSFIITTSVLLSACPKKGGSDAPPPEPLPVAPGIKANSSECIDETIEVYNKILNGGPQNWGTAQDCRRLQVLLPTQSCTTPAGRTTKSPISYVDVQATCQTAINNENSGGTGGDIGNNPTLQPIKGMRNFRCQLVATAGERYGDSGLMNVALPPEGGEAEIFSYMNKGGRLINWSLPSTRFGRVKLAYSKNVPNLGERMTLSIVSESKNALAKVSGHPARPLKLIMSNQDVYGDSNLAIEIRCQGIDAVSSPERVQGDKYRCLGERLADNKKTPIRNSTPLANIMNEGVEIADGLYFGSANYDSQNEVLMSASSGGYSIEAIAPVAGRTIFEARDTTTVDSSLPYKVTVDCKTSP